MRFLPGPFPPEDGPLKREKLPLPDLALALVALTTLVTSAATGTAGAGTSGTVAGTALVAIGMVVLAQFVPWTIRVAYRTYIPLALAPALPPLLMRLSMIPRAGEPWPVHEIAYAMEEYLALATGLGCYSAFRSGRLETLRLLALAMMIVAGATRASMLYPWLAAAFVVAGVAVIRRQTMQGAAWSERAPVLPLAVLACLLGAAMGGYLMVRTLGPFQRRLVELVTGVSSVGAQVDMPTNPRLGALETLHGSRRPVLRFVTDRPELLRVGVAEHYRGGQWNPGRPVGKSRPDGIRRLTFRPAPLPPDVARLLPSPTEDEFRVPLLGREGSADVVRPRGHGQVILQMGLHNRIPCPLHPVAVQLRRILPALDSYGLLTPSWRFADYWLVWGDGPAAEMQLVRPERYLQLPEGMKEQLRPLAEEILGRPSRGPQDAELASSRISAWLMQFTYAAGREAPSGRDPVTWFVQDARSGHCEYFASAMALMLRSLDIPTRYVWGFQVSEADEEKGTWMVRERDAHAWVEVHVAGRGWTTWDPTPVAERDAIHAEDTSSWDRRLEALASWLRHLWESLWDGSWRDALRKLLPSMGMLFVVLGMGLGVVLASWAWRQRGRRSPLAAPQTPPDHLGRLFLSFEAWLENGGIVRMKSEAPGELAARLAHTHLPPGVQEQCVTFLDLYGRARYGEEPLEEKLEGTLAELRRQAQGMPPP